MSFERISQVLSREYLNCVYRGLQLTLEPNLNVRISDSLSPNLESGWGPEGASKGTGNEIPSRRTAANELCKIPETQFPHTGPRFERNAQFYRNSGRAQVAGVMRKGRRLGPRGEIRSSFRPSLRVRFRFGKREREIIPNEEVWRKKACTLLWYVCLGYVFDEIQNTNTTQILISPVACGMRTKTKTTKVPPKAERPITRMEWQAGRPFRPK